MLPMMASWHTTLTVTDHTCVVAVQVLNLSANLHATGVPLQVCCVWFNTCVRAAVLWYAVNAYFGCECNVPRAGTRGRRESRSEWAHTDDSTLMTRHWPLLVCLCQRLTVCRSMR